MLFLGEFEHALDAKQRLAVPSELRACMPHEGEDAVFVAAPGPNGFLWLWPEATFAELAKSLRSVLGLREPKPKEEKKPDEPKKDEKTIERENNFILKTLKADLTSNGIDGDLVDSIGEFIAYDTLKNDEGEANDELVEKFVETLSSIALRQPPKGGKKRDILNSDKEGLGKYLPQNDK